MIVLQDVQEPTENVMTTESQVVAYWEKDCLGQGNLFLTDRQMIWMDPATRKGLVLPIPSIVVHAVSGSSEDFAEPCLFTMIDTVKAGVEYAAEPPEVEDDDEEEDEVKTVALRLIPANPSQLPELFATLNKCQELNPEPDEDEYCLGDDGIEEDGDDSECGENGGHEGEEDCGFDDNNGDEEMAEH